MPLVVYTIYIRSDGMISCTVAMTNSHMKEYVLHAHVHKKSINSLPIYSEGHQLRSSSGLGYYPRQVIDSTNNVHWRAL